MDYADQFLAAIALAFIVSISAVLLTIGSLVAATLINRFRRRPTCAEYVTKRLGEFRKGDA